MNENKNPFKKEENVENRDLNKEEENNQQDKDSEQQELNEDNKQEVTQEEKYEELNNKYIRLAADFDNFRKRTMAEKEELSKYAQAELLRKLTSVLDTFDRAKEHLKEIENCATVKESYEVAYKQLLDTLKKIGLEEIEAEGKIFNPNEHEAITQVPSDELEPDTIAFVAQKGYKIQDRIIRPALVGVAVKKENE